MNACKMSLNVPRRREPNFLASRLPRNSNVEKFQIGDIPVTLVECRKLQCNLNVVAHQATRSRMRATWMNCGFRKVTNLF